MLFRRFVVLLLIAGLFTLVCGCASYRPRVMKSGTAPNAASPHVKGGLAGVHVHAHGRPDRDCFDMFLSVILFLWIVDLLSH